MLILVLLISGPVLLSQTHGVDSKSNPPAGSVARKESNPTANQQKAPPASSDPALDTELRRAQRDEVDAERKYYQAEAEKATAKPRLWERIVPLITPVGALLAAVVAFLSFSFNYRSTLLNQQDTQFFEALKRFGDKDSPAVRVSAAGLLAELGHARVS